MRPAAERAVFSVFDRGPDSGATVFLASLAALLAAAGLAAFAAAASATLSLPGAAGGSLDTFDVPNGDAVLPA